MTDVMLFDDVDKHTQTPTISTKPWPAVAEVAAAVTARWRRRAAQAPAARAAGGRGGWRNWWPAAAAAWWQPWQVVLAAALAAHRVGVVLSALCASGQEERVLRRLLPCSPTRMLGFCPLCRCCIRWTWSRSACKVGVGRGSPQHCSGPNLHVQLCSGAELRAFCPPCPAPLLALPNPASSNQYLPPLSPVQDHPSPSTLPPAGAASSSAAPSPSSSLPSAPAARAGAAASPAAPASHPSAAFSPAATRPVYRGFTHAITSIARTEGPLALYRGASPNVLGAAVAWGTYFFGWVEAGRVGDTPKTTFQLTFDFIAAFFSFTAMI